MTREKILGGGESGAGKTYAAMSIARYLQDSGTGKMIAIEPDDGIEKVAKEWGVTMNRIDPARPVLTPGVALHVFPVATQWSDLHSYAEQIDKWGQQRQVYTDDWVLMEGIDIISALIRYEFVEEVYGSVGTDMDKNRAKKAGMATSSWDAILARRKAGNPIIEPSDYDGIYSELRRPISFLAYQCPANLIATAGTTAFRDGNYGDSPASREFYVNLGMPVKFEGWKYYPRMFDTLMLFKHSLSQGYQFQMFKDRGGSQRGTVNTGLMPPDIKHENFCKQYLIDMAGYGVQPVVTPPPMLVVPPPMVS